MTSPTQLTADELMALVEHGIDAKRRRDGTYRPRQQALFDTPDAYAAAAERWIPRARAALEASR